MNIIKKQISYYNYIILIIKIIEILFKNKRVQFFLPLVARKYN